MLLSAGGVAAGAQSQPPLCHVPGQTAAASAPARLRDGFGHVHLPITTRSPVAQAFFDQGLALLHAAFEASAALDRAYMTDEKELSDHTAGPYAHNLHFLATVYGYEGRYRDGLRVAAELLTVAAQPGESASRAALEGRLATLRLMVRFERWDDILDGRLPDAGGFAVVEAWRHYALGIAHSGRGDMPQARAELRALTKATDRVEGELNESATAPQAALQLRQTLALTVAPLELEGRILAREGKPDAAIAMLHRALDRETRIGYSEPPLYPHPMQEVLGQALLDLKRWPDAAAMFDAALERDPGSGRALFGLMEALQQQGRDAEARRAYREFRTAWAHADADLPQMQRARKLSFPAR